MSKSTPSSFFIGGVPGALPPGFSLTFERPGLVGLKSEQELSLLKKFKYNQNNHLHNSVHKKLIKSMSKKDFNSVGKCIIMNENDVLFGGFFILLINKFIVF